MNLFCLFGNFYASGTQTEVTKSLNNLVDAVSRLFYQREEFLSMHVLTQLGSEAEWRLSFICRVDFILNSFARPWVIVYVHKLTSTQDVDELPLQCRQYLKKCLPFRAPSKMTKGQRVCVVEVSCDLYFAEVLFGESWWQSNTTCIEGWEPKEWGIEEIVHPVSTLPPNV